LCQHLGRHHAQQRAHNEDLFHLRALLD
jgi:hypothetical protein